VEDFRKIIRELLDKLVKSGFSKESREFKIEEGDKVISITFTRGVLEKMKVVNEKCGGTNSHIHITFNDSTVAIEKNHMFFLNFLLMMMIKNEEEEKRKRLARKYRWCILRKMIEEKIKRNEGENIKVKVNLDSKKNVYRIRLTQKSGRKSSHSMETEYLDGRSRRSLERAIEEFIGMVNSLKRR